MKKVLNLVILLFEVGCANGERVMPSGKQQHLRQAKPPPGPLNQPPQAPVRKPQQPPNKQAPPNRPQQHRAWMTTDAPQQRMQHQNIDNVVVDEEKLKASYADIPKVPIFIINLDGSLSRMDNMHQRLQQKKHVFGRACRVPAVDFRNCTSKANLVHAPFWEQSSRGKMSS